jgi:hypothetical protein
MACTPIGLIQIRTYDKSGIILAGYRKKYGHTNRPTNADVTTKIPVKSLTPNADKPAQACFVVCRATAKNTNLAKQYLEKVLRSAVG